ncbi:baseplate J/gp47 family protein [Paenibacillus sp. LHD-117]|uniref:baseplate J/gp47 family protein n=1 Tax=Paenibacillus sp. LHD-117 TaxID=3071412 RepID=UPI0027E18A43|nr:baseplate J/gp47 family protein [Paenibacillus sp. LHD-117]MDQ6423032.1 baseplate J/gp47 family protein [Paenibacillus sp. LHD-117]
MKQSGTGGGQRRPPRINTNNLSSYMEKFKEMAPHYTPEWRFSLDAPDPGTGLAYIAGEMLEETVQRLNSAPMNHLLSFLDLIEVKLGPPRPARARVVFRLSEGSTEPVFVPAGLKLTAANPQGGEPLIFETEGPLAATPAKLTEIVNVNPARDEIVTVARSYDEKLEVGNADPVPLFDTRSGSNEQEHALFIRHDDQLLVDRPCRIYLNVFHGEKRYAEPELAEALASGQVEWSYPSGGEWKPFQSAIAAGNMIILHKSEPGKLDTTEHQGIMGRWIKCAVKSLDGAASPILAKGLEMDKLRLRVSHDAAGDPERIRPDSIYFNDMALAEDGCYPFGEHFVPYSVFYLSSEEAFSKRESKLELTFSAMAKANRLRMAPDPEVKWKMVMRTSEFEEKDPPRVRIRQVVWEYWNGSNWNVLPGNERYATFFEELPEQGAKPFTLSFECPEDMDQTYVNGDYQYWIRARVLQTDPVIAPIMQYMSPWLESPKLSYATGSQTVFVPENVFTRNNADDRDRGLSAVQGTEPFKPFEPIPSLGPSVYLAFDHPPAKGPIRLHFELSQRFASGGERPLLDWEALCRENGRLLWKPIKIEDGTDGLGISGEWQWAGPSTMASARLFGHDRYWIRAINRDSRISDAFPYHPIAESLRINTVAVTQQISQERELAIPADGLVHLSPTAFVDEQVWMDELDTLSPAERASLLETDPDNCYAQVDGEGHTLRFWIKWQAVSSLADSGPDDRHYSPDRAGGSLQFGDGMKGSAPSAERDRLARISYRTTAGAAGRVEANQITGMQLPIAYIDSVSNPKPAIGGSHTESMEAVLLRGPQRLKNRNRAVTSRDIEWIAREAYPGIAKVKCLSNRNSLLERAPGSATLVACADGGLADAAQFPELRRTVESELLRRAAGVMSVGGGIRVIEPAYLEISVHATVAAESAGGLLPLERACIDKLTAFLNFMHGNTGGQGWNIGESLHLSLLYSLLHSVRGLLYIDRLYVHVARIEGGIRTEWDPAKMNEVMHGLVMSGTHRITAVPAEGASR